LLVAVGGQRMDLMLRLRIRLKKTAVSLAGAAVSFRAGGPVLTVAEFAISARQGALGKMMP
jgi:hypothetical protein